MKMFLMSDNVDTLMGMRMSGVEGVVLHSEQDAREKLNELMADDEIAVILITSTLLNLVRETVFELKISQKKPLIIEIPDRHGNGRTKDSITKYVKDAIGVDMS